MCILRFCDCTTVSKKILIAIIFRRCVHSLLGQFLQALRTLVQRQHPASALAALPSTLPLKHSQSAQSQDSGEECADFKWDELEFGVVPTDYMYTMRCSKGDQFSQGHVIPYGNIELSPSAGVLNYGQGLFEGLKAMKTEDGRFLLFRPEENALRMKMGAERMCMPYPSTQQFLEAVKQTVLANKRWVPPPGRGTMYIRPMIMGSGPVLGVGPASEYRFLIFVTPVGAYHKGLAALNLYVEDELHRSTPGGTGGVKSITNYSPMYLAQQQAKAKGFSDVLFLDSVTGKNIEEITACNIFIVKGTVISTPTVHGTVLPGITRKTIMEIGLDFGYQVEERVIPVEDLLEADEAFCTGTGVGVTPIGAVTYQGKRVEFETGKGAVCHKLYETLAGIQTGRLEDKKGWTMEIN